MHTCGRGGALPGKGRCPRGLSTGKRSRCQAGGGAQRVSSARRESSCCHFSPRSGLPCMCPDPPKGLPKRQGCWLLPGRAWQGGPHLPHKLNMRKLYLVATQVSFYDSLGGFFPLLKPLVQAVFPAPARAQLCGGGERQGGSLGRELCREGMARSP